MTTTTASRADAASRLDQVLGWGAVVVPIAAWTVHMVALASLVEFACDHPGAKWVMHGLTIGLGLVCVACLVLAWRHAHLPNGEEAGSTTANLRFLAHLGIAVAAVNLLLIAAEGSYVLFLHTCARS
jgi:hypothetical protein